MDNIFPLLNVCYLLFSVLFISNIGIDSLFCVKLLAIASIYICVRCYAKRILILYILMFVGLIQAIVALFQQIGWIGSHNEFFSITGFFHNPGLFGGFQAVSMIAVLGCIFSTNNKLLKKMYSMILVFICYSLIVSDSRAAFIALVAGMLTIFWGGVRRYILSNRKYLVFSIIVTLTSILLLYLYRPLSVDARLLMWRVSVNMIKDRPIFGCGAGNFIYKYPLYQAEYFKDNPDSVFLMVADNTHHPYNEFINVCCEQGIVGLGLFVLLLLHCFKYSDNIVKGLICSLTAFSMFSYPGQSYGMLVLYPVIIGMSGRKMYKLRIYWHFIIGLVVLISLPIVFKEYCFYNNVLDNTMQYHSQNRNLLDYYNENFAKIKYYHSLNIYYTSILAETEIKVDSKFIEDIIPRCESLCNLAIYFFNIGEYDMCESYLVTATHMIPTRITPKYLLWQFYSIVGDERKSQIMKDMIMMQSLKIENTETLRMKSNVSNKKFIDKLCL